MSIQIFDCAQGSPDWFACRLGIPTASCFSTVLAKGEGKTRKSYMLKLAGEIITAQPAEGYSNADMERGKVMEAEARERYAFDHDYDPQIVGFIRNGDAGCSPDALIDANGGLEIKTKAPHVLIEAMLRDDPPPEHRAQLQGFLWVAEREWVDLAMYWPGMPLIVRRVTRDEEYIRTLAGEVDRFNGELARVVEQVRAYGRSAAA